MKTILIMNHGDTHRLEDSGDEDRSLSHQGRDEVLRIGWRLRDEELVPDHIVCSTARSARQTAVAVVDASGYPGDIDYRPELYGGDLDDYVAVLHALSEATERVLMIGHNPTTEELVGALSGMEKSLPEGSMAYFQLPIDDWAALSLFLTGGLVSVWHPNDHAVEELLK
jgi:phosphohistidine phosphatase